MLLAWWALVAVVSEIPSGIIADKWSKKWLIVIAPLLKASCFAIWALFGGSFLVFALGFLLWGSASALLTGTFQAFIYDSMAYKKNQIEFPKVLSKIYFWKRFGIAIGFILGGLFASIALTLPFYLSLIPLVLGILIALRFEEVPKVSEVEDEKVLGYLIKSLKDIKGSKEIQYFIFGNSCLGSFGKSRGVRSIIF